uniref:Uncharacterized protein n=1 Tax=Nelumbo nucifera TaxID=4432 RepID=A0A822YPA1_NELNU|nr:TPA_asm: hypothetical protein HUJ06_009949 [Nelumbo nucifera]
MTTKPRRNKYSLWEKSMKMAMNIVRVSSFSLSKASLGATTRAIPANGKTNGINPGSSQRSSSQQEPERGPTTPPYLMFEGNGSSLVISKRSNIDDRASDFIQRFHEKNRNKTHNMPKSDPHPLIVPPQPQPLLVK